MVCKFGKFATSEKVSMIEGCLGYDGTMAVIIRNFVSVSVRQMMPKFQDIGHLMALELLKIWYLSLLLYDSFYSPMALELLSILCFCKSFATPKNVSFSALYVCSSMETKRLILFSFFTRNNLVKDTDSASPRSFRLSWRPCQCILFSTSLASCFLSSRPFSDSGFACCWSEQILCKFSTRSLLCAVPTVLYFLIMLL